MPRPPVLRVHRLLERSRANGPGLRSVLWVQGCTLGCPGCFNPETHTPDPDSEQTVDDLAEQLIALAAVAEASTNAGPERIQGLTVSGGEPLQQIAPLTELLRRVRAATDWSVLVLTGFAWDEVQRIRGGADFLEQVDVLIAGRYREQERRARGLRGSANKTLHCLTDRYQPAQIEAVPEAEVIITSDGEILVSGVDPLVW